MTGLQIFVQIIIVLLSVAGPLYYVWQTLHGTIVPHRLTYFFWFVVQVIAVVASLAQGATIASQFVIVLASVTAFLIFVASFYQRDGVVWKLGFFDWSCAVLSVVGIVLWQITDIPNLAIIFAILADFIITMPTLIKSYRAPETETIFNFIPILVAHILNIIFFSLQHDFPTLAMQVYLVINIIMIIGIILLGRWRKGLSFR